MSGAGLLKGARGTAVALVEGSMSGCPFGNFRVPMLSIDCREIKDENFRMGNLWACSEPALGHFHRRSRLASWHRAGHQFER